MGQSALIIILTLFFAACTKEGTKNGTPDSSTPKIEVNGTISGGGGQGVRCKKNDITTLETLDLYEAKKVYNLSLVKSENDQDKALDLLTSVFTRHFWNPSTIRMPEYKKTFRQTVAEHWFKNIRFIGANQKLKLVADAHPVLIEEGCEPVQIAVYYDESILLIDKSLWDELDWTNKIALLAHELVYFSDRQNGAADSTSARKLVGQLFSVSGARPKAEGIPSYSAFFVQCRLSSKGVSQGFLYAYDGQREERKGLEFVFNYLKNGNFLFRTSAFLHGGDLANLMSSTPDFSNFNLGSDLFVESYLASKMELKFEFVGGGRGKMYVLNKVTGVLSDPLDLSCSKMH
jgi:hypothetical protein